MVKSIVSRYICSGSSVFACFLDASKAFDTVDHNILFCKPLDRGLPLPIVRFFWSWYGSQKCRVRWGSCLSDSFSVTNGVCQGSVLSPFLFAVYLDCLLAELVECGVGCYWGYVFAGCLCYADDIVLLAPCPSALRMMLNICCNNATGHGLEFNSSISQLICFRNSSRREYLVAIYMNGSMLQFSDEVTHLGHILIYNLQDKKDIIWATKDLNRKANYILSTFNCVDPSAVKSFLSVYGYYLLLIQVTLNHLLRKIWIFPHRSHTTVCHCLGQVPAIRKIISFHCTLLPPHVHLHL